MVGVVGKMYRAYPSAICPKVESYCWNHPTCPVTGQVLKSLELKPNIGLAGAIEEWVNRNVEIQVKCGVEQLSKESMEAEGVERVLDVVYKISGEHPSNQFRVRNAGLVVMIVSLLRKSSKSNGTVLRRKALMALLSMAKDEESKLPPLPSHS